MATTLPFVLSLPLPGGCRPVAARVEVVADDGERMVLLSGAFTAGDLFNPPALISDDEWSGRLAVTTARLPLAPAGHAPSAGDSHDR